MSVKEHLYLLLLIFKQENLFGRAREGNLGSRQIFLTVLAGHKKLLTGRYLPTPALEEQWRTETEYLIAWTAECLSTFLLTPEVSSRSHSLQGNFIFCLSVNNKTVLVTWL
jgi:hypothetical protein